MFQSSHMNHSVIKINNIKNFALIVSIHHLVKSYRKYSFFSSYSVEWYCNQEEFILNSQRIWSVTSTLILLLLLFVHKGLPQRDYLTQPTCEGLWHILKFFVWQRPRCPSSVAYQVAQKFTFGEAGITDRCDIFVCWYARDIPFHTIHEMTCKEVKLTHPPAWGLPF